MKKIFIRLVKENLSNMELEEFEIIDYTNNVLCTVSRLQLIDDFPEDVYDKYSGVEIKYLCLGKDRPEVITLKLTQEQWRGVMHAVGMIAPNSNKSSLIEESEVSKRRWVDILIGKINIRYWKERFDYKSKFWKTD